MSFKCKIGAHSWDGCTCSECGAKRDEHHDLKNDCEKCAKCGQVIEDNHDWSKDCDRCSKCGKTRTEQHSWSKDCEKCSHCGKVRHDKHQLVNGLCSVCGHGTFKDETDGKLYKVVKIGEQIIMSENFAKKPSTGNFWCYDNNEDNVVKFGYLYDWETAKSVAPKGWHLPTKTEWETLYQSQGGHAKEDYEHLKTGGSSGFEALFGGWRYVRGAFNSLGASAHFWSDTAENETHAWHFKMGAYSHNAEFEKGEKGLGLSVRFFKDK